RHPHGPWSIAPELYAEFCEINGNDSWRGYASGGEWATSWAPEIMGYELQRCAREAPVFNSEDHFIADRNVNWQPPEYIYNVFWQGAIHGRGASSTWVWERTYDMTSDFCGSILHRPECIEAQGWCTLDLNRLADEVTALQRLKPQVAALYSYTGLVWDSQHEYGLKTAWPAVVLAGHKAGFVFERQLEALGDGAPLPEYLSEVKVLVLPGLTHLSRKAIRGLEAFTRSGGKVIVVGKLPDRDEYDKPARAEVQPAATLALGNERQLMGQLDGALAKCGVVAPARLVLDDGSLVFGVEYFATPYKGGWLVNISNYRHEEPRVHLLLNRKRIGQARELISGRTIDFPATLPSLQPLLLEVR
ncbi:MAG: hypothetical protein H5T86_13670, partial [Armatimonadetes bacterium]|nr:hypothetical protein [Armatimonadota bacterium]